MENYICLSGIKNLFLGIGILFNFVGTLILIIPLFQYKIWEDNDDEEIPDKCFGQNKNGKYWFTRKGLLKNRKSAIWGLSFNFFGLLLQFFSIFL